MIDADTLRCWLFDRARVRFKLAYGGTNHRRSCFGAPFETNSFAAVLPPGATIAQLARRLELLTEALLEGFCVEKPGGLLVLLGDEPTTAGQPPAGIEAEVKALGTAQRVRLIVHAHPTTLEAARAQLRATALALQPAR